MFERDLPGKNTTGWGSSEEDIGDLPKEICETINGSWGFNLRDRKHKSSKELIHYLIKAAGYGSNLLLNVGPMPNGKIQPTHKKSLKEIGNWLELYGETIYETKQGPLKPNIDFVSTQKNNIVYVHFLNSKQTNYEFNGIENSAIKSIKYFNTNLDVDYSYNNNILSINLNKDIIDDIEETYWVSSGNTLPHVLTFSLPSNKRFEFLSFIAKNNNKPETWAKHIRISSADPFPHMGGWEVIADLNLSQTGEEKIITIDPKRGRYFRLEIFSTQNEMAKEASFSQFKVMDLINK